ELVAGAGRRDPYRAVETVARVREGIEGVRIEASASLGRGESSNRRPRCVGIVVHEDDSPERGRSFADAARHIAYVQGARGHDGPSRQRVRTRRLPLQGKRARVGMHLEGVEVHRRELVAQKSEPMMKQGPGE